MKHAKHVLIFSLETGFALLMLLLGAVFIRSIYLYFSVSRAESVLSTMLLAALLLLIGAGVFSSTLIRLKKGIR